MNFTEIKIRSKINVYRFTLTKENFFYNQMNSKGNNKQNK